MLCFVDFFFYCCSFFVWFLAAACNRSKSCTSTVYYVPYSTVGTVWKYSTAERGHYRLLCRVQQTKTSGTGGDRKTSHFPCSTDHEQDWQPDPVDAQSAMYVISHHFPCSADHEQDGKPYQLDDYPLLYRYVITIDG